MGVRDHTQSIVRILSHEVTTVPGVEIPFTSFGEVATGVDCTANEAHGYIALFFPVLDGEPLDVEDGN